MSNATSFKITYDADDADSDVLYISKRQASAAKGVEDQYGFLWRYDMDGVLIGLTIVDFLDFWRERKSLLTKEISEHFLLSPAQAQGVLNHALSGSE